MTNWEHLHSIIITSCVADYHCELKWEAMPEPGSNKLFLRLAEKKSPYAVIVFYGELEVLIKHLLVMLDAEDESEGDGSTKYFYFTFENSYCAVIADNWHSAVDKVIEKHGSYARYLDYEPDNLGRLPELSA